MIIVAGFLVWFLVAMALCGAVATYYNNPNHHWDKHIVASYALMWGMIFWPIGVPAAIAWFIGLSIMKEAMARTNPQLCPHNEMKNGHNYNH